MNEALIALSRAGRMKLTVSAARIASREQARKLWPLVTPNLPHQLLTYVSPTFNSDGALLRRGHFRTLPKGRSIDVRTYFDSDEAARAKAMGESAEHKRAKEMIALALIARLQANRAMPWSFADPDATDFYLSGNLLLGAELISTELSVKTAFGSTYRMDVGIVSAPIGKRRLLLGGIEIERDHAFDGRKALISKSQAFPLISIDITHMTLAEITPQWADYALSETTTSSEGGRRKTFIYLHDILYPLYVQLPPMLAESDKSHQFLIFASDGDLDKLLLWIKRLGQSVGLKEGPQYSISRVRSKSEQSETMLINAGEVAGPGWETVNPDQCLRLTVRRPKTILDTPAYLFHLTLARILLVEIDSLVGYKYMNGILNESTDDDVWVYSEWVPETRSFRKHRILPKRLSEPHSHIMELLSSFSTAQLE